MATAFFADGMIIEGRRCSVKRAVRERRYLEGYRGPVFFRPCPAWAAACAARGLKVVL